jgi:hypothetical protein
MHLAGEYVDLMFRHFTVIVNSMKANIIVLPYSDHDRALKLLHALDRSVWGMKVDAIIEFTSYETLVVDELFSKLKSTEVHIQLRAKHENSARDPTSFTLVSGMGQTSSYANPKPSAFALSSLLFIIEEQLEGLDDDELALFARRMKRFSDNQRERWRGKNTCFECGRLGHFAAERPSKDKAKNDYFKDNSRDKKKNDHKKKEYKKTKKYGKGRKERGFIATVSNVDTSSNSDDSTESSSSEEEVVCKGKKKKASKNINGLCYLANKKNTGGYCVMAHSSNSKEDSENSDSEPEAEVKTHDQLVLDVKKLNLLLDNRDKVLREFKHEHAMIKENLADALSEIEKLKSEPVVADVAECDECMYHMLDLTNLKSKCAALVEERDLAQVALDELKLSHILLSTCDACPTLQIRLDESHATIKELEKSSIPGCRSCLA